MLSFDTTLVVTHVAYRETSEITPSDGPFTSICNALKGITPNLDILQLPLSGYDHGIFYGKWGKTRRYNFPAFLGRWIPLKYLTDLVICISFLMKWLLANRGKNKLVIGIDPLSTLPLAFLRNFFDYKLIFYSVDFNLSRFNNPLLQKLYEKADEISSRLSDQVWTVCESIQKYKKRHYSINAFYIPNSVGFDISIYEKGKHHKTGNKIIWVGTLLTERQYGVLFGILKELQKIRPDLEFVFAPTREISRFKKLSREFGLKKFRVVCLDGRREAQKLISTCDVGIAVYDEQFGSTEFIEPMKIWDFMLGGVPFIISSEPSISKAIRGSGVAFFLDPANEIPRDRGLKKFLGKVNLLQKHKQCLELAKRYDVSIQVKRTILKL